MKDSPYCFLHRPEPEVRERALVAQRRGGQANIIVVGEGVQDIGWPKQIHLRRPRDVRRFVSKVMNEVRAGQVEPGLANSLFVGASVLLKTFDSERSGRTEDPAISEEDTNAIRRLVEAALKPPATQQD